MLEPGADRELLTERSQQRWATEVDRRLAELGRTRKDAAAALGLPVARLSRWLNKTSAVELGEAMQVLAELGIPATPVGRSAVTMSPSPAPRRAG